MTTGIDEIIAHLSRNNILKPSIYEVNILGGATSQPDAPRDVMFNCSSVSVPGLSVPYTQDKRTGVGVTQNVPNNKILQEVTLTFYESDKEKEREYFIMWVDKIYDKKTKRFDYYKNYTKTVQIKQFSRDGKVVHETYLYDAWPTNLSPLEKGYAMHDTLPMWTVNLSFNEMDEVFYDGQGNVITR